MPGWIEGVRFYLCRMGWMRCWDHGPWGMISWSNRILHNHRHNSILGLDLLPSCRTPEELAQDSYTCRPPDKVSSLLAPQGLDALLTVR